MVRTHFRHLRSMDTKTERYVLVKEDGTWHGEMRTLMEDGSWNIAWFSENFPNERGAFEAVKRMFNF